MPNHVHALIAFRNTEGQSINSIIGTGKRFMAYETINRLEEQGNQELLNQLASFVNATDRRRGWRVAKARCPACLSGAFAPILTHFSSKS
jgi:hypothetical protein